MPQASGISQPPFDGVWWPDGINMIQHDSTCINQLVINLIWLVVYLPTPLKNYGLRQLGSWNSQYMEYIHGKIIQMFQTTNITNQIWVWVNTYRYIFSGMNNQGFDPSPYSMTIPLIFHRYRPHRPGGVFGDERSTSPSPGRKAGKPWETGGIYIQIGIHVRSKYLGSVIWWISAFCVIHVPRTYFRYFRFLDSCDLHWCYQGFDPSATDNACFWKQSSQVILKKYLESLQRT